MHITADRISADDLLATETSGWENWEDDRDTETIWAPDLLNSIDPSRRATCQEQVRG
jgi:hypothetical protein